MENFSVASDTSRPSVLFVDDEPRLLSSLKRMLRKWTDTIDIAFAQSGEEALGMLSKRHFDIVFSDMRMPGMSGTELLRQIRKLSPDSIRVILSGQADQQALIDAIETNHRYISKPFTIDSLSRVVEDAVLGKFWVHSTILRKHIALLSCLPVQSEVAQAFHVAMNQGEDKKTLAQIAHQDLGLSIRLIHLAHALVSDNRFISADQALDVLDGVSLQACISPSGSDSQERDEMRDQRIAQTSARAHNLARRCRELAEYFCPDRSDELEAVGFLVLTGELAEIACFGAEAFQLSIDAGSSEMSSSMGRRKLGAYLLSLLGVGAHVPRIVAGEIQPRDLIHPSLVLSVALYLEKISQELFKSKAPLGKQVMEELRPFITGLITIPGEK